MAQLEQSRQAWHAGQAPAAAARQRAAPALQQAGGVATGGCQALTQAPPTSACRLSNRMGSRVNWQAAATSEGGGREAAAARATSWSTSTSPEPAAASTASRHVLHLQTGRGAISMNSQALSTGGCRRRRSRPQALGALRSSPRIEGPHRPVDPF